METTKILMETPLPPLPPALPRKSGLAVASLILGICGIVLCLGPLAGIPAVVCGHMALSRIRKSAGAMSGQGLAIAGLVTGYFSFVMIVVIGLLAAIAVPNFVVARKAAQKAGCVVNLKLIQSAKEMWALDQKKTDNDVPRDADLFGPDKALPEKPTCPAGGSYSLNAVKDNPTCSFPGHTL